MREDLLQWDSAIKLAKCLDPSQLPKIYLEYASEMECTGDYVSALMYYEEAIESQRELTLTTGHGDGQENRAEPTGYNGDKRNPTRQFDESLCNAGIARVAIRLGDVKRGAKIARESRDRLLKKDCADLLDQKKHWQDAVELYEQSANFDLAVAACIHNRQYKRAGELLTLVEDAPHLHIQYARAREAEGDYAAALGAYTTANDWDAVVRLYVEKLNNIQEAVHVATSRKTKEGAKMIAQHFIRTSDYDSAVKFLILSDRPDAAYQLARRHRRMELYAELLGVNASSKEYQSIACYFEGEKNWLLSGRYYFLAKIYNKAVNHLLRAPYSENSTALDMILEAVGQAKDGRLTSLVVAYLTGQSDGVSKDPRHLFRLHMELKQYKEAARTAIVIARDEQTVGNYRTAHGLLFNLVQELNRRELKVPYEMFNNLALLHSYMLAKFHVKNGDHFLAARMLIRVAESISKFPLHIVPILTSTVIECQKAGLKGESLSFASMLLQAEYREKLEPKYRRKFETLIRRPDRNVSGGMEEQTTRTCEMTPCPSCSTPLPGTALHCFECRSNLPYCVITGLHIIKSDLTLCPSCKFPALYSEVMRLVNRQLGANCPMCSQALDKNEIRRITDPDQLLRTWITSTDESTLDADTKNDSSPNDQIDGQL